MREHLVVTGKGKYLFVHKVVSENTQKETSHAANSIMPYFSTAEVEYILR